MSAPEIRGWGRQRGATAQKGPRKRGSVKGLKRQSHYLTTGWLLPDSKNFILDGHIWMPSF
eukprot:gene35238-58155_t